MMETKLISVQRSHGRATLVLSTGETLVMPRAMLKERPYRGGTPFDREAFDSFLRERSYPFAVEKAVALLAMRSRDPAGNRGCPAQERLSGSGDDCPRDGAP